MEIKKLKIGKTEFKNNVLLAPMAGYTDYAFRKICLSLNAGAAFTELTSAKGMVYNSPNNGQLLKKSDNGVTVAQIFGSNPDDIYSACTSKYLENYDIIDINMGCPVPKVFKNGEGSALLKDILKAESVVKGAVKSGKTVTAKIRIGLTDDEPYVTKEYAKMIENAGAKMLTIHGRTRDMYYSGEVNYKEIESAKNCVSIPVIANGGIFTKEDADNLMNKTGADGVMIARGAVANPYIFSELTGENCERDIVKLIFEQIDLMKQDFSDRYVTLNIRKFLAPYFKGRRNSKEFCKMLYEANSTEEIKEKIINGIGILDR